MLLPLLVGLVLLVAELRSQRGAPRFVASWRPAPLTARDGLTGAAVVVATNAPLLAALPSFFGPHAPLSGDGASHAQVVAGMAHRGLSHGWVDAFIAGFPLAIHYPPVGWLAGTLLVRLGLVADTAVQVLGMGALLVGPLVLFLGARRAGASVLAAAAGAATLAWTGSSQPFVGGHESFLRLGLLSQCVAIPVLVGLGVSLAMPGPRWLSAVMGALMMAAHPQIGLTGLTVMAAAVLASGSRPARERLLRAGLAGAAVAVAIYGAGLRTLRVPFGWPTFEEWKITGFPAWRMAWWIGEGEFLDAQRLPVLTSLWLSGLVVCVARPRRGWYRAALTSSLLVLALCAYGRSLREMGALGAALLAFLQPMRALALVPLVAAAAIVTLVHEVAGVAWPGRPEVPGAATRTSGAAWAGRAALVVAGAVAAWVCLPDRAAAVARRQDMSRRQCQEPGLEPARSGEVAGWLARLDHGRLWYRGRTRLDECIENQGMLLGASVPVAYTDGAGSHVGIHWRAYQELRPASPGSAVRAEALGVRYLLHQQADGPVDRERWRERARAGTLSLDEREGGTDEVGVGCVEQLWAGTDSELRNALNRDLEGPAQSLDLPHLIALEPGPGALVTRPVDAGACAAEGAIVQQTPREPGVFEAQVTAPAPVDVVIRTAAMPWWHVQVDGAQAHVRTVAPGFLATRVGPGTHHVVAEFSFPWWYWLGLATALSVVAVCATWSGRWATLARLARASDSPATTR